MRQPKDWHLWEATTTSRALGTREYGTLLGPKSQTKGCSWSGPMLLVGSWKQGGGVFLVPGNTGNMQLLLELPREAERNGKKRPCSSLPSTYQSLIIVSHWPNPVGSQSQGIWGNVSCKGLKRDGSKRKKENHWQKN